MARAIVYGILGIPIGAIAGLALSPTIPGAAGGAFFGWISGICLANYLNRMMRDQPFATQNQIDSVMGFAERRELLFFPPSVRRRIFSYIRAKLEKRAGNDESGENDSS